jgi:hypothetical protein
MRFLRLLLFITVLYPIHAQTIGGGTCTQSTLNGTFFYLLGGTVVSQGVGYAYAELVKLIPDGNGNVSGHSESSLGGSLTSYTLTGTYTVQGNCSATMALSVNGQAAIPVTVQITNGGLAAVLALPRSWPCRTRTRSSLGEHTAKQRRPDQSSAATARSAEPAAHHHGLR